MTSQDLVLPCLKEHIIRNYSQSISTIRDSIRQNLGDTSLEKIENRLRGSFHMSLDEAIMDFDKFDLVLREFFGDGAKGLESRFLRDIINKTKISS